jgi:NAD(P)-dependent dehydrogenase (short-subunit alcohol dehydrogenase family)
MPPLTINSGKILITGGTSGLGLELVKIFLRNGYEVVATGRKSIDIPGYEGKFNFYRIDFSDLRQTALSIREICRRHEFDFVVNNAGILSPSDFTTTKDGMEYTFQVNFLANLLVNEIILNKQVNRKPFRIAAVTSPAYRLAKTDLHIDVTKKSYKPVKAYSDSKLFLALMCRRLSSEYNNRGVVCFSFDPGIFSSEIYRTQNIIFRKLYRFAAPFMRQPKQVATVLADLLSFHDLKAGAVYNINKKIRNLQEPDKFAEDAFWRICKEKISPFLEDVTI